MDRSRDLLPGQSLGPGDNLYSATRAFRLTLQGSDGRLALGVLDDRTLPKDSLDGQYMDFWQVGLVLSSGEFAHADMQEDGNFVLYETAGTANVLWDSGTFGSPGAFLRCQDDGNLVVYEATGSIAIFASNTFAGFRAPDDR
jgi:hypothetical protein